MTWPPYSTIKEVLDFFGMSVEEGRKEWGPLSDREKDEIRLMIANLDKEG